MYILPAVPVSMHSRWQKSCLSSPFTPPYTQEFYRCRKGANFCQQMALNTLLFLSLTPMHLPHKKCHLVGEIYTFSTPVILVFVITRSGDGIYAADCTVYIYIYLFTPSWSINSYFIYTYDNAKLLKNNFFWVYIWFTNETKRHDAYWYILYRKVSIGT